MKQPAWTDAECEAITALAVTQTYTVIGARYGISRSAVENRLCRWRKRQGRRPPVGTVYTTRQVAAALGCSWESAREWRHVGVLPASAVRNHAIHLSTPADIRAFLAAGYALSPTLCPPPTALFWRGEVERIRADLLQRWVYQRDLRRALGVTKRCLSGWLKKGFPQATFAMGCYGAYLDRAAVVVWLTAHPTKATRAAWRLLSDGAQSAERGQ